MFTVEACRELAGAGERRAEFIGHKRRHRPRARRTDPGSRAERINARQRRGHRE